MISNRVYRLPAYAFYPQSSRKLSTDLGFVLEQISLFELSPQAVRDALEQNAK
jgi:hypothetical protein